MWTLLVLLYLPATDHPPGVEQVGEFAYPKALLAQPSVAAPQARVLRRLARLDVAQLDLPLQGPCQEETTCRLRAFVATDRQRTAMSDHDLIKQPRPKPAREPCVHFQRRALPREGVHYAQHADRSVRDAHFVNEIRRPLLVGVGQHRLRQTHVRSVCVSCVSDATPPRDNPPWPLMVRPLAFPFRQYPQSPIVVARLLPQNVIRSPRPITTARYCNRTQPVDQAPAGRRLLADPTCIRPSVYELHPPFAITPFSISLSGLIPAINRFRHEFSSSSARRHGISHARLPPNFAFHVYIVASLMRYSRARTSTVRPLLPASGRR